MDKSWHAKLHMHGAVIATWDHIQSQRYIILSFIEDFLLWLRYRRMERLPLLLRFHEPKSMCEVLIRDVCRILFLLHLLIGVAFSPELPSSLAAAYSALHTPKTCLDSTKPKSLCEVLTLDVRNLFFTCIDWCCLCIYRNVWWIHRILVCHSIKNAWSQCGCHSWVCERNYRRRSSTILRATKMTIAWSHVSLPLIGRAAAWTSICQLSFSSSIDQSRKPWCAQWCNPSWECGRERLEHVWSRMWHRAYHGHKLVGSWPLPGHVKIIGLIPQLENARRACNSCLKFSVQFVRSFVSQVLFVKLVSFSHIKSWIIQEADFWILTQSRERYLGGAGALCHRSLAHCPGTGEWIFGPFMSVRAAWGCWMSLRSFLQSFEYPSLTAPLLARAVV